jgi:hypothetical protein
LKVAYTAFMLVLVPFYWYQYGPTNFLFFCDVALFLTLAAVLCDWPLPAGMALVGIFIPQMVWVVHFLSGLLFGNHLTGMTRYMFDPDIMLFARGLSLFHGWLPFLLLYIVWRLGYDRRSFLGWSLLAAALIMICFLFIPGPPQPSDSKVPVNINYVYGMDSDKEQVWMPRYGWLALLIFGLPLVCYLPMHLVLFYLWPAASRHVTVGSIEHPLTSAEHGLPRNDGPPGSVDLRKPMHFKEL